KVVRQVPLDPRGVAGDAPNERGSELRRERRRSVEECERPAPRDQPEGDLETARPVDAHAGRVRPEPFGDRVSEAGRIALVTGAAVRLAEPDEPLVPVELPDNLAVPDHGCVEWVEQGPVEEGSPTLRHGIEMPVDRIAKGQISIAEQVEPLLERAIGCGDDAVDAVWHPFAHESRDPWIPGTRKEMRGQLIQPSIDLLGGSGALGAATALGPAIDPLRHLLPGSAGDLGEAH